MYETKYHKAQSIEAALAGFAAGDDPAYVSGGQTLLPTMKARLAAPSDLVDLTAIAEMQGITANASAITIGAATTHAEVAASEDVRQAIPALAALAGHIGDPAVRNRGTIGGSIANNDPSACYPAACLGLGATITTNQGEYAADEFFTGMFETALDEGEIVTGVMFPIPKVAAYEKFENPASRYALVGAFVAHGPQGLRVAITGAGNDGVFRHGAAEAALGSDLSGSLDDLSTEADDMLTDLHATAAYRAHLVNVMIKRAVAKAS